MDIEALEVKPREKSEKAINVRKDGWIPAELYGHGIDNESLKVEYQTFRKLYRKAGDNTVLELHIGDSKKKVNVLVHRLDLHPVTDLITHIDFINVRMDEEVHTHIPFKFVGTSPAVKEQGGMFNVLNNDIEVKCLPKDLVHEIEVDVTVLKEMGDIIHFADVTLPKGITMLNNPETSVAMVTAPRVETEEAAPVEGAIVNAADVPVVGEEKKEGEGAEEGK